MADNFVSYATDDRARITRLVEALKAEGFSVFWDVELRPGEVWDEVLERELLAAKAVIVAWTDRSRASRWVKEEANFAFKHRKLIPLSLDESGPPFGFTSIQAADFVGWDGDKSAECWQRLKIMLDGVLRERARLEDAGAVAPSSTPATAEERRPAPSPVPAASEPAAQTAPPAATPPERTRRLAPAKPPRAARPLPWLALLVALATLAGLAIADVFQNGVLAAAIILAASLYALFQAADVQMQPAFKALAERWLIPVRGGLRINVAEAFHTMFQAVFYHRHWSWRCAWRSALASTIAFAAFFAFGWFFVEPFRTAMTEEWGSTLRNLILLFLAANLVADYLSLFQTRLFIRYLARHPWAAPIVVIIDFIATVAILAVVLYVANGLQQWVGFTFGANELERAGVENVLGDAGLGEGAARDGEPRTFAWPTFAGYYQSLIPQLTNAEGVFDPLGFLTGSSGKGIADLWARTWVLIVASATTYITSIWLLFIMVFGSVLRLLVGRDGHPALIGRLISAQRRPFTALGAASAAFVVLLAAPVYGLAATGVFDLARPGPDIPVIDPVLVEQADWDRAQSADTVDAYARYLDAHPDGPNAQVARARIAALEEADAWARAQSEDGVEAYRDYLSRYSQGANANAARARIAEIEAEAAQASEQAAWDQARETNTIGAYRRYLDAHPDGANADAAREQIAALEDRAAFADARRADTIAAYERYLADHPDGVEIAAARARIAALQAEAANARFSPGEAFRDRLSGGGEGPEMVVVPAGSFTMGSPESEADRRSDEGPQRRVTIAQPFAVGRYEVTFAEWEACVAGGGCSTQPSPSDEGWGRGRRPVINVSWNDAQDYVAWLNGQVDGSPYRLLSEAEWEYVARAGATTRYSTGETITTAQANFRGDTYLEQTVPVGSYQANAFGLYDMHGNVWEWAEDCYADNYSAGQPTNGDAYTRSGCSRRVLRGGSWYYGPQFLRSASRGWARPSIRSLRLGFRLARTVSP